MLALPAERRTDAAALFKALVAATPAPAETGEDAFAPSAAAEPGAPA